MFFAKQQAKRRPILWGLLACYVFLLGGLPSVDQAKKTDARRSEERFPCENCPCGCSTAEFCWDQCCCYSDSEKIEWAAANGVTPPTFLTARVAKSSSAVTCTTQPNGEPTRKCCCCAAKSITAKPKQVDQPATTSVVLFWKAAQCRGVQSFWKMLSMAVVGYQPNQALPPAFTLASLVIVDESAESPAYAPVPPVPWTRPL